MENGTLYVVATPIGNLEDITLRAIRVLSEVSLIAAEDTRHTIKLLNHLQIHCPMISYHDHNRHTGIAPVMQKLEAGEHVALVTDAGLPCISDPGWELVAAAYEQGHTVTVIPGPCAAVTAVALSGLDCSRFCFEGFLPRTGRVRKERIQTIAAESRAVILYEAPHRLGQLLSSLAAQMPDRPAVLLGELTKVHERRLQGTVKQLAQLMEAQPPKGEFVLILAAQEQEEQQVGMEALEAYLRECIAGGMRKKDAVKQAVAQLKVSRSEAYDASLRIGSEEAENLPE